MRAAGHGVDNEPVPADRDDLPPLTYGPVPYVPEVSIFQAPAGTGLWDASGGAYHSERPPPFWAFPWAGGQALARYVLDHPDVVANRTVLDFGAGSGLVAIAAAYAGAAAVRAVEVDPAAIDAIRRNVAGSGRPGAPDIRVDAVLADLLSDPGADIAADVDVLLAGDVFYTGRLRDRSMRFLRRAERLGIRVLVGDGDRGFLPADRFDLLASYDVPTPVAIEDADRTVATVWELRRSATVGGGGQPMRSVAAKRELPTTPGTGR
jgi:predicted nicotinamide N-methyase